MKKLIAAPVLLLILSGCGNSGSSTAAPVATEFGYGYLTADGCSADENINFSNLDDFCRGIGNEDFKWHCDRKKRHERFRKECSGSSYTWDDSVADDGTVVVVDDGDDDGHHRHHHDDEGN